MAEKGFQSKISELFLVILMSFASALFALDLKAMYMTHFFWDCIQEDLRFPHLPLDCIKQIVMNFINNESLLFCVAKTVILYGYNYSVYITYIFKNRDGKNMSGS